MRDLAHEWTNEQIRELEVRIHEVYAQAAMEMEDKISAGLKEYERERKKWVKLVQSGERTQREFDDWLERMAMEQQWRNDMMNTLAYDAMNADVRARQLINDELPTIYVENANIESYLIERATGFDLGFTLYNHDAVRFMLMNDNIYPAVDLAKDFVWNRRKFNSAIMQSVLQGESIPNAALRLMKVMEMDETAATRAARTSITYVESAGTRDAISRADKMGIPIKVVWHAVHDGRTRFAHRQMDGVSVMPGEKFIVDGHEMSGPGDPEAPGYLIYNCRCNCHGKVDIDGLPEQVVISRDKFPSDVSYDDWKMGKYVTDSSGTETKASKKARGVK